ncbi:winged helix-turn-helix transcriptional regulator [Paracoccus seriniphilus]|uniref:Transcriptional regulator, HxlR family n=1 Tax=Paracoccus seriniphilus TaxID=184748 RepID=A0A239PMW1_9RHOB|nr:helix-turn-helix domain-containing protein [Paracoccus seriniphilus]WCR13682.1 helix-turn-helix transcriptional regulator [Paracoccus seriniphilus]SNT68719.1 transcriptional regulator, HxlR family [Paracoccus seriniphilus]
MTKIGGDTQIRYDEGCLAAHALNVIGDRWALLVVRELIFVPKRFQAIRAGLPGITASVLTRRIAQLVESGVVRRMPHSTSYALTDSGRGLLPVLQAMCRWGAQHPGHDPCRFISPTALMISMAAMAQPVRQGVCVDAGFDFGEERFLFRLRSSGAPEVEAVETPDAPFVLSGSGNALAHAVYGPFALTDHVSQGRISLSGDVAAAQDFVDMFQLRRT